MTTYKMVAESLGTNAYRAVGSACNRNPHAPEVPCHRVVASDGSIGGYARGQLKKKRLLEKEGIRIRKGKIEGFERIVFMF